MLSVSAKWDPALRTAHGLAVQVDAVYNGVTTRENLPFTDGSVKVDRGSETRYSLTLTIPDPADFPAGPTDTFSVYGQRLWVRRGVRYLDGSVEMVPAGMYVITGISGNAHTGPLTIQGAGLEHLLKITESEAAQSTIGLGTPFAAITYLANLVLPDLGTINLSSTGGSGSLATRVWDPGTPYWDMISEIAASIGAEVYCNAAGSLVLADIPDPEVLGDAVWDVDCGASGVMASAELALSSASVFNRVVATGENTADNVAPIRQIATLSDPTDPLRYGGPFGKRTKRISSPLFTNAPKALIAAQAELRRAKAPNRTVGLATIPNPALEAGDRIRVDYGAGRSPELHLVHSFEIPLTVKTGTSSIATVAGKDAS